MPFRWVVTWTDGRSTTEFSELQANIPIDAGKICQTSPASATKKRNSAATLIPKARVSGGQRGACRAR